MFFYCPDTGFLYQQTLLFDYRPFLFDKNSINKQKEIILLNKLKRKIERIKNRACYEGAEKFVHRTDG